MNLVTLYYSPRACSMASHVALEEAGIPFSPQVIDIFKGEHLTPEYLAVNPRAKVPALRTDDGTTLVESPAILTWIGRTSPDAQLLGHGETDAARCVSICSWLASTVHPAFGRWVRPERFAGDEASQAAVRKAAKEAYWSNLQELDAMLAGKDWLLGDRFTVCDPYAMVFYGWGPELDLPVAELRNLTVMKDRLLDRPKARVALEREQSGLIAM